MQLKYGTYQFDAGACKIATSMDILWNDGGQPYAQRRKIDVDGYLSANGQAAISTAMSALTTALSTPYQDLNFYQDDGALSATTLTNATSIGGVQITSGPNFPDWKGGEYGQFRRFTFSAEAEYPITNSANLLLSFAESMTFDGGGPVYAVRPALNGPPQRQLIYQFSVFKVVQEGRAVGYRKYPTPPVPRWPNALARSPNVRQESPQRRGKVKAAYDSYPISWVYNFESPTALTGFPSIWLG